MRKKTLDGGCVVKGIRGYELPYRRWRNRRRTKEREPPWKVFNAFLVL